ncbi:MAG: hypothetical protein LC660_13450 [Desulfobacteraceae bacterium]|nr:hypothetical protein [Desulfobacteraceae bacterium]
MKAQPDMPLKILLVDDEQEFVQTLAERLQMRDMDSTRPWRNASRCGTWIPKPYMTALRLWHRCNPIPRRF